VLNKEEELGCFEILKNNFPILNQGSLVVGLFEFLLPETQLDQFLCQKGESPKEAAVKYIKNNIPYIVLDESEGYQCLFLRGNHVKIHYNVSQKKMIRYIEVS
jgi:hypothetical protein